MNEQALIRLHDVAIGYGRQAFATGLDLAVAPRDFWAVVGPNGAGKSTLLKVMLGILRPMQGTVWRSPGLRTGYVPQRAHIDPIFPLTALEVVRAGAMGTPPAGSRTGRLRSASREQAMGALERLGIAELGSQPLRDLSGGQQQRVLIARALVRSPDLLVLDEPAAGMDMPSERELLDFVGALRHEQGTTIVLVVHQVSLAAGRATKLALINKDQARFVVGTTADLLSNERLSELYQHPMQVLDAAGETVVRAVGQPAPRQAARRADGGAEEAP